MTVHSLAYFAFLLVLVLIYYTLGRRLQWVCLLGGSLFFCFLAGKGLLLWIGLAWAGTYAAARGMGALDGKKAQNKQEKAAVRKKKKRIAVFLAAWDLGLLFFVHIEPNVAAPLGISYYTLQSIGYLVDVYKGKTKPEKNFWKTGLFLCFFPQLTQGPIGRFSDLGPQLWERRSFSYEAISRGCVRILWGLFKKAVIADRLKPVVDSILGAPQSYSGMTVLLGCMYMSIQMYADFSAYMDIVAGTSELFGIRLAENFRRPFFSQSLAEYWRRWHMTLSGWFRDYVFYPLSISKPAVRFGKFGKKRFGVRVGRLFPAVYAMAFVWVLTGLWHGASWRFVLWGAANGAIMIFSMCMEPWYEKAKKVLGINGGGRGWRAVSMARTFLVVSLLKVFPGAGSTRGSLELIRKMLTDFRPSLSYQAFFPGLSPSHLLFTALGLGVFFAVSCIQEREPVRARLQRRPAAVRWCCWLLLAGGFLCMGAFEISMVGGFAYAQY